MKEAETQSQRIRRMHEEGWELAPIARMCGCSLAYVRQVLSRGSQRGRPRQHARVEDRCRRMVAKILGESRSVREAEEALELAFERRAWEQKQYGEVS